MKKAIISLLMSASLIFGFNLCMPAASAAAIINIGDYVKMGTYYGVPILWRCVSFEKISGYDAEGNPVIDSTDTRTTYADGYLPLMLSDRIICNKQFDAAGDNTDGSHGRTYPWGTLGNSRQNEGSNYWADSNMRCWLNSAASAGNVVWTCGNPPDDYADEAGFLTNFSQKELNAVKQVTQKSILGAYEYSDAQKNPEPHNPHRYGNKIDDNDIYNVVQNYDTAYSEQVTDMIFLLDVKQVNNIYNNRSVLGDDYYIGKPTSQCVANSEYKDPLPFYWLRSPQVTGKWTQLTMSNDIPVVGTCVRQVGSDGTIESSCAHFSSFGVRPAFYLDLQSADFICGTGTINDRYALDEYVLKSKEVTYDYTRNGGTWAEESVLNVLSGEFADLFVAAAKAGSEFIGWNTNPDAVTALSKYSVTNDVTLYAIFRNTFSEFYATRADALNVLLDTTSLDADISVLDRFPDVDLLSEKEKRKFAYCVEQGLIKGYPDGTLRPLGEITRGEYAVIIERLRKDKEEPKTVFDFDLNYDDSQPWCERALKFCSANLIMLGYGNKFGIDNNLTNEQLQIIKKRFNAKANYDDICVALLLQNLDELDYDAVIQSGYDEKLRFSEEDIPRQSEESKEYWKQRGVDRDLIEVSYYESEPADFKYYCVLNTEFNTAFDYEKYIGNDAAILRLSSRKSFLKAHSTMYGVKTPLFEEGNEILEKFSAERGRVEQAGPLSERDEYISEITDKIRDGVKVKAFFVSSAENYLYYTHGFPGSGTKCANKGKGYEYFKYISGAPEGLENGKWYRRVVHAELMLNGETPSIRYWTTFDVKYDNAESVPEYLLKN